jgi:succinate dehydrogenase hydrophobic anchor subunit
VVIADDYIVNAGARKIIRLLSIAMMLSMIAIGLYILWTS